MGRKFTFALFILLATMLACHNTASEIGAGLITGQQFDISYVDTLTIKTSTIKFDSIVSSNTGRLLVGYHDDPKLGPVMAKTVFQIAPPSSLVLDPNNHHFVKLVLQMYRDQYYYYDTLQPQTINVYRVLDEQKLYNGALYNVDHFRVDRTAPPLGSLTFAPRPNLKDSLEIPLSDELGQEWMHMAQFGDPNILPENFAKIFFGLALIPDSTQSRSFLGFGLKNTKTAKIPEVRLYYLDDNTLPGSNPLKYVSFIIGGNDFYWTTFTSDRSATKLAPLKVSTDILPSSQTDNEIYLQAGTGIAMRLEIPHLQDLNYIQPNFQATKALLTLTPIKPASDFENSPPRTLAIDLVNSANQALSPGYLSAGLFLDAFGVESYTVDITSFVNGEINTTVSNIHNALVIRPANGDISATVNRLYLGDQRNYYLMQLKVYYITLTEDHQ